jgi:hypothetical protein
MTPTELSDRFDVLYNNIMSNAAPGLNEYEKSVFLTKAQSEIIKNYFNPNGNKYKEGFDQSPKRQIDFSMLMRNKKLVANNNTTYDLRGTSYTYPNDVLLIVNESLLILNGNDKVTGIRQVIPITYDTYTRVMSKPFKEPLKNQAWRLITGVATGSDLSTAEIIPNNVDRKAAKRQYQIRYVKKPRPIIVADLDQTVGDVTIEGEYHAQTSELDPSIHEEILQRAVELAKASYASDQSGQAQLQNQITVGQRSE